MPFLNNIPQPGDFLDTISQPQLLGNMQQLDLTMGVDHYRFSDGTANNGKHNKTTFPAQAVDPATAVGEGALYTKVTSGLAQLFWRAESNGAANQITGLFASTGVIGPPPTYAGSLPLFGAMILKWGNTVVSSTVPTIITFPVAFPNACVGVVISVNATAAPTNSIVTCNYPSVAGFSAIINGASNQNCFWLALGF
jgi:hypothetical protein